MDASLPQPRWQGIACWAFAIFLSILFIVSGAWKLGSPIDWAARLIQFTVPGELATPATLAVGIAELFGGVLILVPRFRRWGGWLLALLLAVFMAFVAIKYKTLVGAECSCFPMVKRAVGPMFFVVDGIWLLMALAAAKWAAPPSGLRPAALLLAIVCVFAGASYAINRAQQTGIEAPATITVDGQPTTLRAGRIFLYFFDPECSHCFEAAKQMSGYTWKDVKVIAVPTRVKQFAGQFLTDTGLKAPATLDADALREKFKFTDPPYGVMLENGRQKHAFIQFDEKEPRSTLKAQGYIEE
jgi:uncharacterized membrane protein YphA (DoxX/SURF4 family)